MLDRIINENTEYSRTSIRQDGTPTMYSIPKEDVKKYINTENIYFLSGGILSEKKQQYFRFKDHEIHSKNYFAIDIDLRNQYPWEITNIEIVREWLSLASLLWENHELFWEWSYIVFSGNGIHIYYVWDEISLSPIKYKLWVKRIFKMWDDFIGNEVLYSDHACCNLARILRLPETKNQKNGATVKILAEQKKNSALFNNISLYSLIEAWEDILKNINIQKQMLSKNYGDGENDDYEKIQSIPAHQIAMIVRPEFTFSKNGKNFNNKKKWFTWYYYVKETNSICNWWSRYFSWGDENSCFAPFQIIQKEYSLSNGETFAWFREKFTF